VSAGRHARLSSGILPLFSGTTVASGNPKPKGGFMLWILAIVMGGLGFGYVTVRRRRKADSKTA
jgi:hypothetical protein